MAHLSPVTQAVMLYMRDGNYHTMHAFPYTESALRAVTPDDVQGYLELTHDTLLEVSRSLSVWARYPLLEKCVVTGQGVSEQMRELSTAHWKVTQPQTRDIIHVSALVYGGIVEGSPLGAIHSVSSYRNYGSLAVGGSGPHPVLQGKGGSGKSSFPALPPSVVGQLNNVCAVSAAYFPDVRDALAVLTYPAQYTDVMAAEVSVGAATAGASIEEVQAQVDAAFEVVPTFTVDGVPITGLLDAALEPWAAPLYVLGMTWEQICAYERADAQEREHAKRSALRRAYSG